MKRITTAALLAGGLLLMPLTAPADVGGGDVEFKPKGAGKVLFRHETHMNYKGHTCSSCHFKPFSQGGPSYHIDMNLLSKGAFCGKCHDGKTAFDVKDAVNCDRCHTKK
jgi:c(7)-type cytochrome triheme protein